jgi:hypothetical protein
VFLLKTLGDLEGFRWLDGHTIDGTVALAPSPDPVPARNAVHLAVIELIGLC